MIYKILHRKVIIGQQETHKKRVVPAPPVEPLVLLLLQIRW